MTWRALEEEIARWRGAGRVVEFWWRDDDATAPNAKLQKLLELSTQSGVPLALAVIPLAARPELFEGMRARVLMHGTDHRNRAAPGEKKTEFPAAESQPAMLERLERARERLLKLAGASFLPVLAPPWNRFKRELMPALPSCGLAGFSAYGPRSATRRTPEVVEVNTHVDIIDWRGTRGFCGEDAAAAAAAGHLAARRTGEADSGEPTGWLTHHELHDSSAWEFLERLFERTRRLGVNWVDAKSIFTSAP